MKQMIYVNEKVTELPLGNDINLTNTNMQSFGSTYRKNMINKLYYTKCNIYNMI